MLYKSVVFQLYPLNEELSELLVALLDGKGFEGVFMEEERVTRITSYNVCYTKLLRITNASEFSLMPKPARWRMP